jgi:N-acetylneuraminic acid mutarotase
MKLAQTLLLTAFLLPFTLSAQWSSRATFPGTPRAKSTSFTVADKIYVLGGVTGAGVTLGDFWEYDIITNTWLQKPNFPGAERYGAAAFVIDDTAYVGTGGNDNGYLDDLWQYIPGTSGGWFQKTGLPAGQPQHENQRVEGFAFAIDGKGYLGGGSGFVFGANSTGNIAFYDLWEYNPATNGWTPMADIPDFTGRNMSIGVTVNGKGYVGLGCNVGQTINHHSFWEYDAVSNSWTAKADLTSNFTTDAGAFALNSELYLVGGVNLNPVSLSSQFYKYDPAANTWSMLPAFNGGAIAGEFAVSTGTRAFAGTGYNAGLNTRSDVWELITTSVNETTFPDKYAVSIYPNPSGDQISVSSIKEISSVEISDIAGNVVESISDARRPISITQLDEGMYHLKIKFTDGSLAYSRFIRSN